MNWTLTINVTPITVNVTGLGPLSELAAALSKHQSNITYAPMSDEDKEARLRRGSDAEIVTHTLTSAEAPPAKRTRKKADDPKQVEAVTGRRVEGLTDGPKPEVITDIQEDGDQIITTTPEPQPTDDAPVLSDTTFNWTLDQLKATFVPKIDDEAMRAERNAHAKSVLSGFGAQTLSVLDAEHYPAFAAAMTEWYKAKGFELQLPEGAE
jgi:hypothetical protein